MSKIQLIVGLGNPGASYQSTRHNAGAWFVEQVARDYYQTLRLEKNFQSLFAQFVFPKTDDKIIVLYPQTFMNLSGQAVSGVAKYYHIPASNILVAHDELDLPCGTVRLKNTGGHAGHNGLKDIIAHLGTKDFWRLRIGIDRPPHLHQQPVADYVLHKPSKQEREAIDDGLFKASSILDLLFEGLFDKAMLKLHSP